MKKVILSFATLAILVACGGDAKVEEKPVVNEVVATVEQQAVAVDYTIVDSSSVLNWEGSAVGKAHFGTVNYKGTVKVADGKLIGGELVFDLTTIDTKDLEGEYKNKLDGHLKAADFFNVDSFPNAKLDITAFNAGEISANLTIKEVTKAITFPGTVTITEEAVNASAEFTINRTEYGIVYGSGNFFDLAKDKIISDDIKFKVTATAVK
ncbi:MAG: YceI family protein [Flavobacteriales bacterium]|nr:YceI family protein [Flavobacteriales bacterium]